jgi:hypothetical protein
MKMKYCSKVEELKLDDQQRKKITLLYFRNFRTCSPPLQ